MSKEVTQERAAEKKDTRWQKMGKKEERQRKRKRRSTSETFPVRELEEERMGKRPRITNHIHKISSGKSFLTPQPNLNQQLKLLSFVGIP